ncbi:DUF2946 family protein [Roseateles sp. BYS180W]
MRQPSQRPTAWTVLVTIVLWALWPTLSHLLRPVTPGISWVEVCSATGARLVALEGTDTSAPAEAKPTDPACCLLHALQSWAAPPQASGPPQAAAQALTLSHWVRPALPSLPWATAQARAPPLA